MVRTSERSEESATATAPTQPVSAHDVALRELRQMVLRGDYRPGSRIVQEAIATSLGLSVIPVREALKSLENEGLVVFRPRRGFFVTEFNREELLQICDIRSALEGMAVRRALGGLDDSDFTAMEEALVEMRSADENADLLGFIRADRSFHFRLFEPASMPQLMRLITLMWDQSDHYRAAFLSEKERRHANHDEHELILSVAKQREAERLVTLLDEHRLSALSAVDRLLGTGSSRTQ